MRKFLTTTAEGRDGLLKGEAEKKGEKRKEALSSPFSPLPG